MQRMRKLGMAALAVLGVMAGSAWAEVGTGSVLPESGWFPAGTNLTATATPDANSEFDAWSGDTNSATFGAGTITFTVNEPKSIMARFTLKEYTVTFDLDGKGTRLEGGALSQLITHGSGATAPVVAANAGWVFNDWDVAFDNITSDLAVTALYDVATYQVTFDLNGGALVSGDLIQTVNHGSAAVAPVVTPPEGYEWSSWDVAFDSVTADITVTAQYQIKTYTLIYIAGANGSVSGDLEQTVDYGSSGTAVTAVASNGFHFVKWDDNLETASRTDANVTASLTVTAEFAQNQYSFVVSSERGTSSPLAGTTNWHAHGATVDFAMTDSPVIIVDDSKFDATGWVGTGSAPATGTETNGFFVITENSTLTWQWSTNYWVELNVATE